MSHTNDPSVNPLDSARMSRSRSDTTGSVGLVGDDISEDDDQFDDYIEFARSSGSACRHLNRARRHRSVSGAPDRFDE